MTSWKEKKIKRLKIKVSYEDAEKKRERERERREEEEEEEEDDIETYSSAPVFVLYAASHVVSLFRVCPSIRSGPGIALLYKE